MVGSPPNKIQPHSVSLPRPKEGAGSYFNGPIGFQNSMQGLLIDLADAPVEALVDSRSAAATRTIDTIF